MPDENDPPLPTNLVGLDPEELLARGMRSVRMTASAGAQGWEPPTIGEAAALFPGYKVLRLLGRISTLAGGSVLWTRRSAEVRDIQWLALPPAPSAAPAEK